MKALVYLRVSTKEQAEKGDSGEGYSIPAQREACLRYCAEKGFDIEDEFVDAGESAKSADRPHLKAMLRRASEGDVAAVVVHKVDRLARNIEDHVAIRAALRKHSVELHSVSENIEETASGKLVEGIHALMAEFYSSNLASEVRKGMTQKAKQGQWPARAPIGYLNDVQRKGGRELKRVILDPDRAMLVKEAFRLYATGEYSLAELQAEMASKGLTSPAGRKPGAAVPISGLARMLANPFHKGIVEWGGVQYQGQHKALVSPALFQKVQEVLRERNFAGTRERKHEHYLKGLLYCGECGRRLSFTIAKGKYGYFYCLGQKNALRHKTGCTQPYVGVLEAEKMVEDLYRQVQLPKKWVKRLEEELEAEIVDRQSIAADLRAGLTKRLASLAEERQKLLRAYYANAIPLELMKEEQDRITEAETSAKAELEAAEADLEGWQEVLLLAIGLAGRCHEAYLRARPKVRRRFNEAVMEAAHIADGKAKAEFNELFDALFLAKSSNKALNVPPVGFEPTL